MDRLEAMALFLDAIDAGSLSAAGRKRGMPLASVSRKVADLEAHLKARLFNRSTKRLTLTEAGRSYAAACKRILDDVHEAERTASGEYSAPRGELIITAPLVFGRLHVLPVVTRFMEACPEVSVRLILTDRLTDLQQDQIDVAIRIGPLPDSSLIALRVGSVRQVVCASPAYFARRGIPKNPHDLLAHNCVVFGGLSASTDRWTFRGSDEDIGVPIRSRLTVSTAEAAIDAAIHGAGLTRVLSYQIADAYHLGQLDVTLTKFEPSPWPVHLVYAEQRLLPLKLRAFLDFTTPLLRSRIANVQFERDAAS